MDKDLAKQNLIKLVARFRAELESGKTAAYSEEDTKYSFINPLLSDVLGWDKLRILDPACGCIFFITIVN